MNVKTLSLFSSITVLVSPPLYIEGGVILILTGDTNVIPT